MSEEYDPRKDKVEGYKEPTGFFGKDFPWVKIGIAFLVLGGLLHLPEVTVSIILAGVIGLFIRATWFSKND